MRIDTERKQQGRLCYNKKNSFKLQQNSGIYTFSDIRKALMGELVTLLLENMNVITPLINNFTNGSLC